MRIWDIDVGRLCRKHLVAEHVGFAISADMTKELRTCCLTVPAERWTALDTRDREQVDLFAAFQHHIRHREALLNQLQVAVYDVDFGFQNTRR